MNRYIKKLLVIVGIVLQLPFASTVFARAVSNLNVGMIMMENDSFAYFNTTTQPPATCNMAGYYFKFDATTTWGKNFLAILLSAKATNKTINVWYADCPVAGGPPISTLTGIGVN